MDTPELSVVIASYRCRELLDNCLASLANDRNGVEVIVVDNDSRDGTVELVETRYPWVTLVDAGANIGFSAANNLGLSRASGRFLLLLNPDTAVPRGALAAAVRALKSQPDVGMLGVKLVQQDGRLDHACKRGFPTAASALYHFMGLSRRWPTSARFAQYTAGHVGEDEVATVDAVNGAFMLVRRDALEDVGPLDEGYWLYMEDLDWCYRFWERGWKILYWPVVSVIHVKGGSSGTSRTWRTNRAFHLGMWRFYRKHYLSKRSPIVSGAVLASIWAKLLVSATRSAAIRGFRRVAVSFTALHR